MASFQELINQGTAHAWLFVPMAVFLGALHGMEPGHSKTMMAAFIIAVRGTVSQAVLLGLSAAVSHSLIIWLLAGLALHYSSEWNVETTEPYFQIASGILILAMAVWMFLRTRHEQLEAEAHDHHHHHGEDHDHSEEEYEDSHQRAHADDIARRFTNRNVTTGQIILFGLTGGLLPCPAAFTILLVCVQLKEFTLGFSLVLCFSLGLAITMVSVGAAAAWGVRHASRRIKGFSRFARRAPYFSSALLALLGIYIGVQGWLHLAH